MQVSRTPLAGQRTGRPAAAGRGSAAASRCTASPWRWTRQQMPAYGALQPLAPGMQLEADVLLERRRLIEWLFEPVLGMVGRV